MSESRQDEQEGFLTRWSRRKTLSRQGEELPEPAEDVRGEPREAAAEARQPSAASEEVLSQQASEEAGLPEEAPELPPATTEARPLPGLALDAAALNRWIGAPTAGGSG